MYTVQQICVHSTVAWLCNRCIFGIAGSINWSLVMTPNYNHVADSMYLEMTEMIDLNCLSVFTGGTCGIVLAFKRVKHLKSSYIMGFSHFGSAMFLG